MAKAKTIKKEKIVGAIVLAVIALVIVTIIVFSTIMGKNKLINGTGNLMKGIKTKRITSGEITKDFKKDYANFCISLLESCADSTDNVAFAPSNVMSATAFLGAAADNESENQLENAMGMNSKTAGEGLSVLESSIAFNKEKGYGLRYSNTAWLNSSTLFGIKKSFLKENAKYYGLGVQRVDFSVDNMEDVSNEPIFDATPSTFSSFEFGNGEFMNIVSGSSFEARWKNLASSTDVEKSLFAGSLSEQECDFFKAIENRYIDGDTYKGVVKDLEGGYSFVGLVPKPLDDIYYNSVPEIVRELKSKGNLLQLISNSQSKTVAVTLPSYANSVNCPTTTSFNNALSAAGVKNAFAASADFTDMAPSSQNLHVNNIVAAGDICFSATGICQEGKSGKKVSAKKFRNCDVAVSFSRSFLYFVFDNDTGLPIYCGILNRLS